MKFVETSPSLAVVGWERTVNENLKGLIRSPAPPIFLDSSKVKVL